NARGARNVSATPADIAQSSAGKSPDAAERQIVSGIVDRVGDAVALRKSPNGVLFVAHEALDPVKALLRSFKARHPGQSICSLTLCSPDHAARGCLAAEPDKGAKPFSAVGHCRDSSPFAKVNSPRRQNASNVAAHNGLCTARRAYAGNPSPRDVVE